MVGTEGPCRLGLQLSRHISTASRNVWERTACLWEALGKGSGLVRWGGQQAGPGRDPGDSSPASVPMPGAAPSLLVKRER